LPRKEIHRYQDEINEKLSEYQRLLPLNNKEDEGVKKEDKNYGWRGSMK
jgi:hypothetical protein